MKKRVFLVTKNRYDGHQRQLAWFVRHPKDLYFDVIMDYMNSHVSYHKNGNIWRTAPSPIGLKKIGKYFPLNEFREMFQVGTCMILKSRLKSNPPLKETHRKKALAIQEVDLKVYPNDIINIVVERAFFTVLNNRE